jgi:hypothetical protein
MRILLPLVFAPAVALAGTPKPVAPAPPPEVKATVDAFKGNWTFAATVTAPGMAKPATFKIKFDCKPVAGGTAVACTAKAKGPMGPFDAMFVSAYDPYSKAVHFVGFTNSYEVHDHACQWKGTDLECAPLKGGTGAGGDEITEDVAIHFDKNACTFTSTTHGKDGSTIVFEGKGKR